MKQNLILIGGGGHCISCIDVIESTKQYSIIGILDKEENFNSKVLKYDIIGNDSCIPEFIKKKYSMLITIGQIKSSSRRRKIHKFIIDKGGLLATIIASTAYVSRYAEIGKGSIVMHNAFINAKAFVGESCIVNTGSIIEHGSKIGSFSHISTNSTINGDCSIGSDVFIGSNTTVNNGIKIYNNTIVASGSLVTKSTMSPSILKGVPAHE